MFQCNGIYRLHGIYSTVADEWEGGLKLHPIMWSVPAILQYTHRVIEHVPCSQCVLTLLSYYPCSQRQQAESAYNTHIHTTYSRTCLSFNAHVPCTTHSQSLSHVPTHAPIAAMHALPIRARPLLTESMVTNSFPC